MAGAAARDRWRDETPDGGGLDSRARVRLRDAAQRAALRCGRRRARALLRIRNAQALGHLAGHRGAAGALRRARDPGILVAEGDLPDDGPLAQHQHEAAPAAGEGLRGADAGRLQPAAGPGALRGAGRRPGAQEDDDRLPAAARGQPCVYSARPAEARRFAAPLYRALRGSARQGGHPLLRQPAPGPARRRHSQPGSSG